MHMEAHTGGSGSHWCQWDLSTWDILPHDRVTLDLTS
jgi:hypothetical protein